MYFDFCHFIILFFTYSFIGYLLEVTSVSLWEDKIVLSRGYLVGPYLPIFGFGALFIIEYLEQYQNDIIALFIMGMVTCCTLEYFTSLLMEKVFHLRWWDYSEKKFNINGRVCLENDIYFGVGAVLLVRYMHPWISRILLSFHYHTICILGSLLFIILLSDFMLSTHMILQLTFDVNLYHNKDATSAIRKEIRERLSHDSIFRKRILSAYPKLSESSNRIKVKEIIERNQFKK